MKTILKIVPELYFMGLGIFWAAENYFSGGFKNYIALLLVWLLFLQLFYKNRILGLVYGIVIGVVSAKLMLGAGFNMKESFNVELLQTQIASRVIFGLGLIMSGIMVYRYARMKQNYNEESMLTATY